MNEASRDQLFRILKDASRFEISERKLVGQTSARTVLSFILWLPVGLFALALVVGLSPYLGTPDDFREWGLRILLLATIAAVAAPVVTVLFTLWIHRQPIMEVIRNPTVIPLWNAKITATTDARYLPLVMEQPLEDIEFLRLEVSTERENLERRVALLIGTIDKFGVIPAFLAAWVSLQALSNPPSWVDSVPYVLVAMYIVGLVAHFQLMRLARMLKLLDLAVVGKKAELESPPNGAPSALV